jgi:hypothetical protein
MGTQTGAVVLSNQQSNNICTLQTRSPAVVTQMGYVAYFLTLSGPNVRLRTTAPIGMEYALSRLLPILQEHGPDLIYMPQYPKGRGRLP